MDVTDEDVRGIIVRGALDAQKKKGAVGALLE
jgi:hypothetical protein